MNVMPILVEIAMITSSLSYLILITDVCNQKTHPVMLYFMECINDSLFGILNIQRCNPLRDIFIVAKKNRVPYQREFVLF